MSRPEHELGPDFLEEVLQQCRSAVSQIREHTLAHPPTHFVGQPPCNCMTCEWGFYGVGEQQDAPCYLGGLSDEVAVKLATEYRAKSLEPKEWLAEKIESHGDFIMKKWEQTTKVDRETILKAASPALSHHHFPILHYMYARKLTNKEMKTEPYSQQHLSLPWLSVPALAADPADLLALLHIRTKTEIQDWATFDDEQLRMSWARKWFNVQFSAKCIVMHGRRYGVVEDWKWDSAHRGDIMGYPRAILLLRSQLLLFQVLQKIVTTLLEKEKMIMPSGSSKWQEMAAVNFRQLDQIRCPAPYIHQAFYGPPKCDLARLIAITRTRREVIGDHIRFLQLEPMYMRHHLSALTQDGVLRTLDRRKKAAKLCDLIFWDINSHWWLTWIIAELENVESQRVQLRDNIYQGAPLPKSYERALAALECLLINQLIHRTRQLRRAFIVRPGFIRYLHVLPQSEDGRVRITDKLEDMGSDFSPFGPDPLAWCIKELAGRPEIEVQYSHSTLFTFLHDYLSKSASPDEHARVDEILREVLASIAALHEIIMCVSYHRPWYKSATASKLLECGQSSSGAWKLFKNLDKYPAAQDQALEERLMCLLEEGEIPSGGRNSKTECLRRFRDGHNALQDFWKEMHAYCDQSLKEAGFDDTEIDSLTKVISAHGSVGYLQAVEIEEKRLLSSQPSLEGAVAKAIMGLNKESAGQKDDAVTKIAVSSCTFTAISCMYPESASEKMPKTVTWGDFAHAMHECDFIGKETGGFMTVYEPGPVALSRGWFDSIEFEHGHSEEEIDPLIVRMMGVRLAKCYGWDSLLFTEGPQQSE